MLNARSRHPSRHTGTLSPSWGCAVWLLGLLWGCGGSGGGGGAPTDTAPPDIITATVLVGSGSPSAGDTLQLVMNEDVQLTGDGRLNDSSFDLGDDDDTLGAVTATATVANNRVIEIVLGAGVDITPGATTLAFAAGAPVVDTAGNPVVVGTVRTIGSGDAEPPVVDSITLNNVDTVLNGGGAAGGTLQVPSNSFTINVSYSDASSAVDPARTVLTASTSVIVDGTTKLAGTDLTPWFNRTDNGSPPAGSDFGVPTSVIFPNAEITLTALVQDTSGRLSLPRTFTFLSRPINESVRTFQVAVNPSQVWYLDLTRDLESFSVNLASPSLPIPVTQAPNGRGDFEDVLEVIGLYSATPIANVAGSANSNEVVLQLFKNALADQLNALWAGANITFTFDAPGAFPGGASFALYNDLGFSSIAICGSADDTGESGILGVALFDPGNHFQDNNADEDFNGQRLGVFFHTIANAGFASTGSSTFRQTFDPFTPARSGVPIGDDGSDGNRLLGGVGDTREALIDLAITRLARFVAVILAHECGHSMGLVANGAMPVGLYGNMASDFPGSNNGHIALDNTLFPGSALNIMSPVIGLDAALSAGTDYNTLSRAYLREQVLIND